MENNAIEGYINNLNNEFIAGWVKDTNHQDPTEIEILYEDKVIGTTLCKSEIFHFPLANKYNIDNIFARAKRTGEFLRRPRSILREQKEGWMYHWKEPETIADSNVRIHCGAPNDKLYERGLNYHKKFFTQFFPNTQPKAGASILDIGIGVGWPMQAIIDLIPNIKITGLDISESMLNNTKIRLNTLSNKDLYLNAIKFTHYDGETFPLENNTYDAIYSYAVLWHIPELVLGKMLKEMVRVLKPGGRCFIQFLPLDHYANDFDSQYNVQVKKEFDKSYLHFYHSVQKIAYLITEVANGVNFDIKRNTMKDNIDRYEDLYYVTFTKNTPDNPSKKIANTKLEEAFDAIEKAIT